jgi:chromosome segregation ATPase
MADKKAGGNIFEAVNNFSGLLTFLSVAVAIVFYFTSIQTALVGLESSHVEVKEQHRTQALVIARVENELKDKQRDHVAFGHQMNNVTSSLHSIEKVNMRLEITLNNLNKRLEIMK